MIKVVKHGEVTKEATCGYCGAVLAYTATDIKKRNLFSFLGYQTGEEKYIVCPDCKREIILAQTR